MKIRIASDLLPVQKARGNRRWVEKLMADRWQMGVNWTPHGTIRAQVIHSLWAIKCPFCPGAMPAEPGDPFWCVDCGMQGNGYQAMDVVWPDDFAIIEGLLLLRPDPLTRNWSAAETPDDLARENAEHGVL